MMHDNQYYKNAALAALKGNWSPAVVAAIVYFAITFIVVGGMELSSIPLGIPEGVLMGFAGGSTVLSVLVLFPLTIGFFNAHKALLVNSDNRLTRNMFNLGLSNYLHNVWTYLLMEIKIFLWCLLLLIPGIVMSFAYAMTPFIVQDNPELTASQAIRKSREMMKGHKFDLFWLELSFIGWIILSIITLGIGFLWLMPYMYTSIAAFYEDLKAESF